MARASCRGRICVVERRCAQIGEPNADGVLFEVAWGRILARMLAPLLRAVCKSVGLVVPAWLARAPGSASRLADPWVGDDPAGSDVGSVACPAGPTSRVDRGRSGHAGEAGECLLIQTALPGYRRPVVEGLAMVAGPEFAIFVGADYYDPTVLTDPAIWRRSHQVENTFLLRRRVLWQRLPVRRTVGAGVVIFEFNPRNLSTWLLAAIRVALRRPNIFWGHAWSRKYATPWRNVPRALLLRLATVLVVYTESQRAEVTRRRPGTSVIAAPNATLPRSLMGATLGPAPRSDFVYVGRLVRSKKPMLLVRAFCDALPALGRDARLVIVGDGPERAALEAAADHADGRILFKGHRGDDAELRAVYASAVASVSPGYVGLSLTQSLGFGVPMLIADREPHSPEIEAARNGWNAVFFPSDDRTALARLLVRVSDEGIRGGASPAEIAADAAERYSVDAMVGRLWEAVGIARALRRERTGERPRRTNWCDRR
jgi:glycosyltransferase involved in cell wall biosynthesis